MSRLVFPHSVSQPVCPSRQKRVFKAIGLIWFIWFIEVIYMQKLQGYSRRLGHGRVQPFPLAAPPKALRGHLGVWNFHSASLLCLGSLSRIERV
jgi:hypothetical protein